MSPVELRTIRYNDQGESVVSVREKGGEVFALNTSETQTLTGVTPEELLTYEGPVSRVETTDGLRQKFYPDEALLQFARQVKTEDSNRRPRIKSTPDGLTQITRELMDGEKVIAILNIPYLKK